MILENLNCFWVKILDIFQERNCSFNITTTNENNLALTLLILMPKLNTIFIAIILYTFRLLTRLPRAPE